IDERRIALAVPQTYMNDSGMAVAPLVRRFGVDDLAHPLVGHDELDPPPPGLKLKLGGGLPRHHGLPSIQQHPKSPGLGRVRIGVGKPRSKEYGADHVLSRMSKRDRGDMDVTIQEAADAVEVIAREGIDAAMNVYNTRSPE